jgi:hypothetical protein
LGLDGALDGIAARITAMRRDVAAKSLAALRG